MAQILKHSEDTDTSEDDNGNNPYQGRWTQEEHDKFLEGLKLFGKDWRRIEEYIGSRTCAQIRSHAQKYFNRLQKDLAKGIKRTDEIEASIILGKKKKRDDSSFSRPTLRTPQRVPAIPATVLHHPIVISPVIEEDIPFQLS